MEFKHKIVLVTGAGSGIGRATAEAFAKEGAEVHLVGRRKSVLEETAHLVSQAGARAHVHALDLSQSDQVAQLFTQLKTLDVAVNNAGIEGRIAELTQLTLADLDEVWTINVRSLFQCVQLEVALLRKLKRKGAIVNVSSVAGVIGIPTSSLYVLSKHAVIGLTKSVALEQISHGIRVNAVSPGGVETPMLERIFTDGTHLAAPAHPIGRIAEPAEIAAAILWLASEQSSFVVGHNLVVDGGRTIQ